MDLRWNKSKFELKWKIFSEICPRFDRNHEQLSMKWAQDISYTFDIVCEMSCVELFYDGLNFIYLYKNCLQILCKCSRIIEQISCCLIWSIFIQISAFQILSRIQFSMNAFISWVSVKTFSISWLAYRTSSYETAFFKFIYPYMWLIWAAIDIEGSVIYLWL